MICGPGISQPQFKEARPAVYQYPMLRARRVAFEGKVFPAYIDRPERQRLAKVRRQKAREPPRELETRGRP